MATSLKQDSAQYTFRPMGEFDDMLAFRAPTWATMKRNILDAQQFEAEVAGWFFEHAKGKFHIGSFKDVSGYVKMPHAFNTGNAICILMKKIDLEAFTKRFVIAA